MIVFYYGLYNFFFVKQWKYPFQFAWDQGDIFKCFNLSNQQFKTQGYYTIRMAGAFPGKNNWNN